MPAHPMTSNSVTSFLNVDLDIHGAAGVRELVQALSASTLILHLTDTEASLEHQESSRTASEALAQWARLIEGLPPDVRALWDACDTRVMNIGIQAGTAPHQSLYAVTLDDLAALSRVGASLLFTVYSVA